VDALVTGITGTTGVTSGDLGVVMARGETRACEIPDNAPGGNRTRTSDAQGLFGNALPQRNVRHPRKVHPQPDPHLNVVGAFLGAEFVFRCSLQFEQREREGDVPHRKRLTWKAHGSENCFETAMCCMPVAVLSVERAGAASTSGVYTRVSKTRPLVNAFAPS
jgi:hypothetical protein